MDGYRMPLPFYMTNDFERMINNNTNRKDNYNYNEIDYEKIKSDIEKEKSDVDYFRQMYPSELKQYLKVIIEILNRIDVKESFLYDEYPDKIRSERLAEIILKQIPLQNNQTRESQRNIIKVLLWEEIIRRRNKRG